MQLVAALQAEVAAAGEAAAGREEALQKFKLQLVKAKKLRQQDAERCAARAVLSSALRYGCCVALWALWRAMGAGRRDESATVPPILKLCRYLKSTHRIAALEAEKVGLEQALASGAAGTAVGEGADEEALAEALAVAEAAEAQLAERTQQAQALEGQLAAVSARLEVRPSWLACWLDWVGVRAWELACDSSNSLVLPACSTINLLKKKRDGAACVV